MGKWDSRCIVGKKHYLSSHQPQNNEIVTVDTGSKLHVAVYDKLTNVFINHDTGASVVGVMKWWRTDKKRFSAKHMGIDYRQLSHATVVALKKLGISND